MNEPDVPFTPLLRRDYRRVRQTLLIWSAVFVFAATAMIAATRLGWWTHNPVWAAVPAVLSAGFLARWLLRASRLTKTQFARELDARWELRSRLETAEELSTHDSPLARAQRSDAEARIGGREPVGAAAWTTGLAAVVVVLALLGVEGSFLAAKALREKPAAATVTGKKAGAAATPETTASIEWGTPEREIKATAIEEVPLTALADSPNGFRQFSLEVFVNGKHQLARPLDAEAAGSSGQPGVHEVAPSLYMDEIGAKPFDIVSYHLVGELIGGTAGRVVTSPLQFIQVRPPQKDVVRLAKANPKGVQLLAMLSALKLGELQLIEANFALTHLDDVKAGAAWQTENTRAAADQADLAKRTEETRSSAVSSAAPALITDNLDQARSAMQQAVKAMEAKRNDAAVEPQGRALGLITECEKYFREALEIAGEIPPVSMLDPFHDDQVFKLEPRKATPAGQLETLVSRQGSLIQRMRASAKTTGAGAGAGGIAADQNEISKDAAALAGSGQLDQAAQAATQDAATAAAAASRQLSAGDVIAAREPAANALAGLQHAADAQERTGRSLAVAELVRLRQILNAASRNDQTDRVAKILAVRRDLRAAATQQQQTGSAEAAMQLVALADSLVATKLPGSTSEPNSPQRARDTATLAARTQVALSPRLSALKRAVRLLNRAADSGADAHLPDTLSDVELASQEAEWLTTQTTVNEDAKKLSNHSDGMQRAGATLAESDWQTLAKAATKIAMALEIAQSAGARDERVKRFNADDIDPAYREAVEAYFERLSRDDASAPPRP